MTGDYDDDEQQYLTLPEAARLYGLSIRTLTRWAENGWLPCVVVAGEGRLVRADLEAIVRPLESSDG